MAFDFGKWDEVQSGLKAEDMRLRELPGKRHLKALDSESARFIFNVALSTGAKRILEIGTRTGFSTLWLGRAAYMNGGVVTALEIDPDFAAIARKNIEDAGLSDVVSVEAVNAFEFPGLSDVKTEYDLVFIDAEKSEYEKYMGLIWPRLTCGGSVLADNITSHSGETRLYLDYISALPDAISETMIIGKGVEWTIKIKV